MNEVNIETLTYDQLQAELQNAQDKMNAPAVAAIQEQLSKFHPGASDICGPVLTTGMTCDRATVVVSVSKRFSYRGTHFECVHLDGEHGSVWFAKDVNSTVILTQPTWKELKQAMKEAVDGKTSN